MRHDPLAIISLEREGDLPSIVQQFKVTRLNRSLQSKSAIISGLYRTKGE